MSGVFESGAGAPEEPDAGCLGGVCAGGGAADVCSESFFASVDVVLTSSIAAATAAVAGGAEDDVACPGADAPFVPAF